MPAPAVTAVQRRASCEHDAVTLCSWLSVKPARHSLFVRSAAFTLRQLQA